MRPSVLLHIAGGIGRHGLINGTPVTGFEEQHIALLALWGHALFDGIVHAVLLGNVVEGSDLCLVSQFRLFDTLVLGNQLLDRLLALWLHIMVFLQLSLGIPQEFHEGCRQCTGRQLAGIDDQGNRFVFDLFLHGNLPSLSEWKRRCQGGTSSR